MCPLVREPLAGMTTVSLDDRGNLEKAATAEATREHTKAIENLLIGSRRNFAKAGEGVFVAKSATGTHIVDAKTGRMVLYENVTPDGFTLRRARSGFALGVTTAREKREYPKKPFGREDTAAFSGVGEWPTELEVTRTYRIIGLVSESRDVGKPNLGALDSYQSGVLAVDKFRAVPKENEGQFRGIIDGNVGAADVVRAVNALKTKQA